MSVDFDFDWQQRNCLETALGLHHEMELPITLCRGERPIAAHWPYHTYSTTEIERGFEHYPDLNVGLVLGHRSGLMEVVTRKGDGKRSEREFWELVDDEFPLTPTFTSRSGYHRLFELDERLASLEIREVNYKSISIRLGSPGSGANCLLPPSITQGVQREWLLHFDDCFGRFERLPYYAVDKVMAAMDDRRSEQPVAVPSHCQSGSCGIAAKEFTTSGLAADAY